MDKKRIALILVLLFASVYYVGRLAIFFAGVTGNMEFEEAQTQLVEDVVMYSFLAIGVIGLAMLPGLLLMKAWGFWGTVAVSVYTIIFDVWAFALVQSSAAIGIIPAGVILGFVLLMRSDYLGSKKSTDARNHT